MNTKNLSTLKINISGRFAQEYPGASIGFLAVENIFPEPGTSILENTKRAIIDDLRHQFTDRESLKNNPVIQAYARYYARFKKSYHVLGQLESALFNNRPLPSGFPLLESIFAVELKTLLLTAVHDLEGLQFPLEIGIATGEEQYTTLRGKPQLLKPGDMLIRDQTGVISSVIYGPDQRTSIKPSTTGVLVAVYAPNGICRELIAAHAGFVLEILLSLSPGARIIQRDILPAG